MCEIPDTVAEKCKEDVDGLECKNQGKLIGNSTDCKCYCVEGFYGKSCEKISKNCIS